jgi:hypothetical protein
VNLKEEGILDNDEDIQVFLVYTETDVLIMAKY